MRSRFHSNKLAHAALATVMLSFMATAPAAGQTITLPAVQVVNVSVNFSTQIPLADLDGESLASSQETGRKFIYQLARDECVILKEVIADTCRLTNLNISTQIQNYNNGQPIMLYINGNANFAVRMKENTEE